MEVEHCVRGDGQKIRNFLHRIKKIVEKRWPVDMEGIADGDRPTERHAAMHKVDKGDNDTLIILSDHFLQGTYNENTRNT